MPHAILDENVSLQVADRLRTLGYEVLAIAKQPGRGMSDETVFNLAIEKKSLLITRDAHFTNPIRFPAKKTQGILYIVHGNLRGFEEVELVEKYLKTHPPDFFKGRLFYLSRTRMRVR